MPDGLFWAYVDGLNTALLGMLVWQIIIQRREDRAWRREQREADHA